MNGSAATVDLKRAQSVCPGELSLEQVLGSGAYGYVVKAFDNKMGRHVAVKFINSTAFSTNDPETASRQNSFQKEAQALARMNHANVVKILQTGFCSDKQPFIIYEYLEGSTLAEYLKNGRTLSVKALRCIFTQIISGIAHAHKMGVVHGDIKPENIILQPEAEFTSTFQVKILDFGLARIIESASPVESPNTLGTATLALRGTPLYMSPEQCQGKSARNASDIYSLGCVLYQCLSANPPFVDESSLAVLYKQIHDAPKFPSSMPLSMKELLSSVLSKDPSLRPDCAKLQEQLDKALDDLQNRAGLQASKPYLLITLLALAIIIPGGIYFLNRLKSQSKESTISSASYQIPATPAARFRKITSILKNNTNTTPEEFRKIIADLKELLPTIKDSRLLFSTYITIGASEIALNDLNAATESFKKALPLSYLNGRETRETAGTYYELIRASRNDPALTKEYADKVLQIINRPDLTSLKLKDDVVDYDNEVLESDVHFALANHYENGYEKKLEHLTRSFEILRKKGVVHAHLPMIYIIDLHRSNGQNSRARLLMNELETAIYTERARDSLDAMNASIQLSREFRRFGEKQKAMTILQKGIEIAKQEQRQDEGTYQWLLKEVAELEQESGRKSDKESGDVKARKDRATKEKT